MKRIVRPMLLAIYLLAIHGRHATAQQPTPKSPAQQSAHQPNIIYILTDDLGYGDVSCLNRESKISTPHLDRLAAQGMIFTDAHSSSAVCTPTRYGILTGRYSWRTHLQSGVLWGFSPPLIGAGRLTVPALLRGQGYHTACIGKWHLGMDWPFATEVERKGYRDNNFAPKVDFTRPVQNGPTSVGFDYYYGISASLDMTPYCFIENDHTVGIPSATKTLYANRTGPAHPDFTAEDVLPDLARKAVEYIDQRAKEKKTFFLYLPLNSPHTPIAPSRDFEGKSGIGSYGDFVMETDWAIGQVLEALERQGLAGNTLVFFTSDNGASPSANFKQLAQHGHNPNYIFRGSKADIWDGGHHIPFIARWPAHIKAGSVSNQTICLTDLMATCAALIGATLPPNAGEDSVSILPALLGEKLDAPLREATIHHSIDGMFAIRSGPWKLVLGRGSGGWSGKGNPADPAGQLYNMVEDPSEKKNLYQERTATVAELTSQLEKYIATGRSTPGPPQKNDVAVIAGKAGTQAAPPRKTRENVGEKE